MENLPEKLPREAGNLNDGQSYERKLLLFVAASLSQNEHVDNFWIVSNPTGIDKIDDVVVRVSFKDSVKKDIAVFIQAKLTSPDKLLWLKLNDNDHKPTKYCYEIKLPEYENAYNNVVKMMSSNKRETIELRKLLNGVDVKDYFVCIFTNMGKVHPELKCKQFDESHPIYFLHTKRCDQYRQFDLENEKFNSNFYKQLYVFLGQPNYVDIDSSIAKLLGEDYKHRLENLDRIVKDFMQRNKLCWVLTKPAFEMNWFKVLVMEWMYINLEKIEEINPKFERLWQNILSNQKVINLREEKLWPLLAYHYQFIIKEVDKNFEWQNGMTLSIKNSIKQIYSENVTDLRDLLLLLWRERKLPLVIRSDCTRNILKFLDQCKTVEGSFVVFNSEEFPDVITHIKQISDAQVLEEIMKLEVSLQGRPPVALSDIGEWQIFSELKITQVLAWSSNLEYGRHHIVGPVLRISDENNITRTFTRKEDKAQDQKQNDCFQNFVEISPRTYVNNVTMSAFKQGTKNDLQRQILTVEDVVELAGPGLHIITGEPGLGKSTVLEELAQKYTPKNFVIYVTLRDCLKDLDRDDTWPSIEADPIQFFFSKMAGESDDNISGPIIHVHKTSKRLCLFLDGFDEILPLHGLKLSSLIASILEENAIPIFCTTRPHGEDQITKSPITTYLELSPFGSTQIRLYLKRIKMEARGIEKLFDADFLSNPLHLNMISQIYEKAGNAKDITRGKIYKIFIELKHTTYYEKIDFSRNYARREIERSFKYHRKLALVDIFGRECVTFKGLTSDTELVEILEDIGEHNIGIVDVSKPIGKFRFLHRTFAEYLVADWLLQMANQGSLNNTHFKYFYEEVMRNHKNICSMVNELSSCFVLWPEASKQLHINSDLFKLDEFGRNVAHATTSHEEQEKWMKGVCKSRLFYRIDSVLQWTCREFFNMKRNENGSTVVHEINKDYPSRTPLTVSDEWSNDMCTKLLTAVDSENTDAIKEILKSKQPLLETGLGIVAFHSAITTGNSRIVKLLLDHRPMLLNEQDCNQNSALHIACAFGCRDIVELLLEKHVNLNVVNKRTLSPSEIGAAEGHLEIVSLLLDHIRERIDVDGHASSTEHYNQLLYQKTVPIASKNERWDVVTWLIEHGADPTISTDDGWAAIHYAAQNGKLEILNLLAERGLHVNAKTNAGPTPLHIAIGNDHLDAIEWLLEHGADPTLSTDDAWAAMHFAAANRQLDILTLLLERGLNVNAKTSMGSTPLHFAVVYNHPDTTKWLLEHGADPTLSNDDGWVAMHYAALNGQLEILTLLLENGLNVNAKTNKGLTPICIAILKEHVDIAKCLLEHGADPSLSNDDGWAAMHFAAEEEQLEILTLLLESGLDVNAKTNTGWTPLHIAIQNNRLDTTKLLLGHGADPTLLNDNGIPAMCYAARQGQLEMLTLLLENRLNVNAKTNTGVTPLCIAIQNNHLDITKLLLEQGADPTLSDDDGWVAMHYAAWEGQLEILTLLLDKGLNVNAKTNKASTPLAIAINNNHLYITQSLIKHGADAILPDDNGWVAMHYAAWKGQLEILTLLQERGLNVNTKTNSGATPLTISIDNKQWDSVKWLLDHGADPKLATYNGWRAIHNAVREEQLEILKILLERGLSINLKPNMGKTLFAIAITTKHYGTVKWLLNHGVDPTLSDKDGWSAMHYAAIDGHLEILSLLLERGLNVNAETDLGETPLTISIDNKHRDSIKWLLDHGADPTLSDEDGWAAMHYASSKGQLDMLELFLKTGRNVDAKTNMGETLLTIAISSKHFNTVEWLLDHGADPTLSDEDGWTAMHFAAATGQLEMLKLLLERGLDVHSKSNLGETAVTISFDTEHWGCVKWLLEHGADHTVTRDDGWSAMHYAAMAGKQEILSLLLDRGLNVNAKSDTGETPLTISIDNYHWDTVKWLLEHGADHKLSRADGWACIHFAAKRGQLEILIILLDRGVNVNARTNMNETPLTIAINYENLDTAKWLLEHGADPTLSDDDGWSSIHFAAKRGHMEILVILLDRGLDVNAETNTGQTPLTIASKYERSDIVDWVLGHGAQRTMMYQREA